MIIFACDYFAVERRGRIGFVINVMGFPAFASNSVQFEFIAFICFAWECFVFNWFRYDAVDMFQ